MMAFIDDEQSEAVADGLHHEGGGIVGGDGQVLDVLRPAAEKSDRLSEGFGQLGGPLLHEVERRDDDERGAVGEFHRHLGDEGFSRARGEDDDAAAAGLVPGLDGLPLIVAWGEERLAAKLEGGVLAGLVVIGEAGGMQGHDDVCICTSFCPPCRNANIKDTGVLDGKLRVLWCVY